jgi:copper transport protein
MLALVALPTSSFAHAQLLGTEPANESEIDTHPDEVVITFSESVTTPFGAVKVYGPDGKRVERGSATVDDTVVTMPFDSDAVGTYAVSWRATSADGHPIRGAFVFHVERRSDDDTSRDAALAASESSQVEAIAFGGARAGILIGVLTAVGAMLFVALCAGSWQPRWLRSSLLLALVSMLVAYVLDASIAAGLTIPDTLHADVLREQASTVYGRATVIRIAVVLACLLATLLVRSSRWQRPGVRYAVLVPFVALAATMSLSGHAVGDGVTALRLPMDMLHSIAAAAWLGGLVQLVPWSRATPVDSSVLTRWSRLAMASVIVLVVTGSWAAWEEIGLSIDGLLTTTYGRLVLVKLVLLVAAMPLANLNRTRNIPAIREGAADAAARLRRYVRVEVGILLLVLSATAWLIQTPPAKVELKPAFVDQTLTLGGGGSVQMVIDPAAVGTNEIHLYAFDEQLQVDDDVSDMELTAYNDKRGLGPLDITLTPTGPGHYTAAGATIPFAGAWRFDIGVKRGKFDEERTRASADIAPSNQE